MHGGWCSIERITELPDEWIPVLSYLSSVEGCNALPLARTPNEISKYLEIPATKVRMILLEMYKLGIVERRTRGFRNGHPVKTFYILRRDMEK